MQRSVQVLKCWSQTINLSVIPAAVFITVALTIPVLTLSKILVSKYLVMGAFFA